MKRDWVTSETIKIVDILRFRSRVRSLSLQLNGEVPPLKGRPLQKVKCDVPRETRNSFLFVSSESFDWEHRSVHGSPRRVCGHVGVPNAP